MGRWRSNLVIRYAGEHATDGITEQTADVLRTTVASTRRTTITIPDQPQRTAIPSPPRPQLIMHGNTGRLHQSCDGSTTLCGGALKDWTHVVVQCESDFTIAAYCKRCFVNSASEVLVASDSDVEY